MSLSDKNKGYQVPKRSRIKYSKHQTEVLERAFEDNHYPDTLEQEILAMDLQVSLERVSIWFQNRRSKFKRQRQTEHMAWMRKQVFVDSDVRTDLPLLTPPQLSVLTPNCNLVSPIEMRIPRSDHVSTPHSYFSGIPGPDIDAMNTSVSSCRYPDISQTPSRYGRHEPSYWNRGKQVHGNQQLVYRSPQPTESRQSHFPMTEPSFPPLLTSYVPSMHSIAMHHVPRTPFSDVMVNSQPRSEQPNSCVEDSLPLETSPVKLLSFENEDHSILTSSPRFKLFDSDSDDSPTKDLTLKLLSKWC